jgi:hypothetical protein
LEAMHNQYRMAAYSAQHARCQYKCHASAALQALHGRAQLS